MKIGTRSGDKSAGVGNSANAVFLGVSSATGRGYRSVFKQNTDTQLSGRVKRVSLIDRRVAGLISCESPGDWLRRMG